MNKANIESLKWKAIALQSQKEMMVNEFSGMAYSMRNEIELKKKQLKLYDDNVQFDFKTTGEPEFRDFRWVDFWYPADNVIRFKRRVYRQALTLLEPMMTSG